MKTSPESQAFESTYALIVRSEERDRNRFETSVYAVLIVSMAFALSQFGRQPFTVPSAGNHPAVQRAASVPS